MPRHDQYGTHDDHKGPKRGAKARQHDEGSVEDLDRGGKAVGEGRHGGHAPNYGSAREGAARTTGDAGATFKGRDYERENYGGGYGTQRKTRDVPSAGRKGEWMHSGKRHAWRGQVGGHGMDGLASERAFGSDTNEQMSKIDTDPDTHYRRWRESEMRAHDEDYKAWRREQARRYDEDYARWKSRRSPSDRF